MEIVLIFTAAAIIGAAIRYLLPGRDRHGMIALPALQVGLATLLFTAAMWAGLSPQSIWTWLIALVLSTAAHIYVAIWLPGHRDRDDEKLFQTLTAPDAPLPEVPVETTR